MDNTETEPKKDTNRVELPADSAAGTQGLLFPTDVPGQRFVGRQAQSKKEDSGRVVNHFSFAPGVAIVFSSVIRSPYLPDAKPKETAGSLI